MAEQTALTVPISMVAWSIAKVVYDWEGAVIYVVVLFSNGRKADYTYSGVTATTLIKAINKADCSVKSQQRRIMERLVVDFPELAGAISGVAD